VEQREGEAWLWGVAIAAVKPLAVVFARKIWQDSRKAGVPSQYSNLTK
jgi:hypothetical protein